MAELRKTFNARDFNSADALIKFTWLESRYIQEIFQIKSSLVT